MKLEPTYRGAVNAWECDFMGHMNVQFYIGKSMEATGFLRQMLGLSPAAIRARRFTLIPAEDRVQFRRELRAGDVFTMASGIRGLAADAIDTYTEVRSIETDQIAAIVDRRLVAMDTRQGIRIGLPEDIARQAVTLAQNDLPPVPPASTPGIPAFDHPGCFETYRGAVNPWEADEHGQANPRFHIHRFSAGMAHFIERIGLTPELRADRNWGLAALDYRITYHRPIRVGTTLQVMSGIVDVRPKVFRIFHHLLGGDPPALATSIDIIVAMFDLRARRAMVIPDEIRRRAEALSLGATA